MNRLLALVIALVVAVGALYSLNSTKDKADVLIQTKLFEDLASKGSTLTSVYIVDSTQTRFHAVLREGKWVATHLDDTMVFPVSESQLSELIQAIASAEIVEQKTSDPTKYARLHVEDLNDENAQSVQLTLENSDKSWSLLVGKSANNGSGQYVREPNQKTSLLINQQISVDVEPRSWLDNPIFSLSREEVQSITFESDSSFTLKHMPSYSPPSTLVEPLDTQPSPSDSDDLSSNLSDALDNAADMSNGEAEVDDNGGEVSWSWQLAGKLDRESSQYDGILASTANNVLSLRFEDVLPRDSALLNSLNEEPNGRVVISTTSDTWQLSIYELDEDAQAWLIIDTASENWKTLWAYQIDSYSKGLLLKTRSDLLVSDEDVDANETTEQ